MGRNSLTVPSTKPYFMIKLDKAMEKTLNKVALPLKNQGSSHRIDTSLNLPYDARRGKNWGAPWQVNMRLNTQALCAISPLPQVPVSLCDLSK